MAENTEEILEDKKEKKTSKKSALDIAKEELTKKYGGGIVTGGEEVPGYAQVISTGSLKLDAATGIGGIPYTGCIIEFIGWESCGKTTIAWQTAGNAQKVTGKRALLVDGEQSFDKKYAKALGVNLDTLDVTQPDCGEDAYNIAEKLLDTKEYGICIIDSQTALKPRKVVDGEVGDSHLGLEARMMGDAVNKMKGAAKRNGVPIIFISQFREKIGVMFGNPETTSGGHALKFYSHMRFEIRKSVEKEGGVEVANKTKAKVIKNKFAAPFGVADPFYIRWGFGVDREEELLDLAIEQAIVDKSGSWFSYKGDKIGQGKDSVKQLFLDNPELAIEIKELTLDKLKNKGNEVFIQQGGE